MKIVYSTDQNYLRHCAASIYSLLENNMNEENIELVLITNKILDNSRNKLENMVKKFKRKISFIDINNLCGKMKKNNDFPISAFARLFLEDLTDLDKVLYIDCDTIIKGSLSDLWNINIDNYYLAGVEDSIQIYAKTILGLKKYDRYLNSGVMLINLKKWRQENLKEKFLRYMEKYNWNVPHNDQGVLNGVCKGNILFISPKYNFMPELLVMDNNQIKKLYKMKDYYTDEVLKNAKQDIRIIHYLSKFFNRPWYKSSTHPLKNEYVRYLSLSGFDNSLIEEDMKIEMKIQKKVFECLGFNIFLILERFLDIRRKIKCSIKYKKIVY